MGLFDDILLTVDFDRTLTAPDSTIPARNLQAIAYFMENGGAFTVNTGRSIPMAANNLLNVVPVNAPFLLYNGSAAYDPQVGELSLCRPIDLRMEQVVEDVQNRFPELTVEVQGRSAHYIFRKNSRWERYNDHNRCPWAYCAPEQIPGPFLKFSLYGEFRDETVASLYEATQEDLALFDRAIGYLYETYGDKVDVVRACARIADVHAKGVSKAASARALQKALGRKILVCVGDAENDLSMLNEADFAYCPADGIVADRFETVCECAKGAVADVIYEKIPAILENKS
jgi:hydroxymethylpyrimidine pyrophosphatase-like HAD family hydrolase